MRYNQLKNIYFFQVCKIKKCRCGVLKENNEVEVDRVADICDKHPEEVTVLDSVLHSFGGNKFCNGSIVTFCLNEDNRILKATLQQPGEGNIAVVDVTGHPCAVVGDTLAAFAIENQWAGIIINGFVRDSAALKDLPIAIWALGTHPRRSTKKQEGVLNGVISNLAASEIRTGYYVYADEDGIIVCQSKFTDIDFIA